MDSSTDLAPAETALQAQVAVLKTQIAMLEGMLAHLSDVVVRCDRQLRICSASLPVFQMIEAVPTACIGRPLHALLPDEPGRQLEQAMRQVFASEQAARLSLALTGPAGTHCYDVQLVPEPGPDGIVATVLGIGRDVTHYAHDEEAPRAPGAMVDPTTCEEETITAIDVIITLTVQQIKELTLLVWGYTYKEIGQILGYSERAIKYHTKEAIKKLHLQNRTSAIAFARQQMQSGRWPLPSFASSIADSAIFQSKYPYEELYGEGYAT